MENLPKVLSEFDYKSIPLKDGFRFDEMPGRFWHCIPSRIYDWVGYLCWKGVLFGKEERYAMPIAVHKKITKEQLAEIVKMKIQQAYSDVENATPELIAKGW